MNKIILIVSLLLVFVSSQQYSITQCNCTQLQSEGDCIKNVSPVCQWDSTKKACQISNTTVTPIPSYATYCDSFAETDCPKAAPCNNCGNYSACAWVEGKCTFFTSCTAFAKKSDQECQAISNRCISDGTHCVEIDDCTTYKKQIVCMKNAVGNSCYWDSTNNTCVDANTCDKLPQSLISDKDCRDAIITCTTKSGGGCIISGNNCSDQKLEIQCVWNQSKTIACYWDGANCKDRICDNAPTNLITDDACKSFRTDGTCTTKLNGGCVTRTTCVAATIKEACIQNILGKNCYWNGVNCVDKICANAPITLTTNSDCAGFLTGCITKSGGGCVESGSCSVANIQTACVQNVIGITCIWDTTCKEKTCSNAPLSNNTHELCTSYLVSCTVKSGGGCQNRTCTNAPITITTNGECEAYLPGQNCIAKTGGGCNTNTTCSAITLEAACIKNSLGFACFWDSTSTSCKDKTCLNAPSNNNTHELCQSFLNTCTVNTSNTGCVDKTCENSLTLAICDKDINNKVCIWKGKCYKKLCVLASSSITTHTDCQNYHSSCTLSNTGLGCVTLPIKCEAITIESACHIKINGQQCGWNGSQCIDKSCSTASKAFSNTLQCQSYISSCVANNPTIVNGSSTIQGCQDLPISCSARRASENCEILRSGFPTCLWVSTSSSCVEKSCATANLVGTSNAISPGSFSVVNCSSYLTVCVKMDAQGACIQTQNPCISNNTSDGCMNKPSSCNVLVQDNCTIGSTISGNCYWNGSNCVDKTCANIIKITHNECNSIFDQCTVNNGQTSCQPLQDQCSFYSIQDNCIITSKNKKCLWTGIACRNATCADAPDTIAYDSDQECQGYPVPDDTCTVIYKIGGLGCASKLTNCTDYMIQAQCHQTISNQTGIDDCKWIVDKCYSLSTFATGACSSFKGTQAMCLQYRTGCTNVVSASAQSACSVDCTLKTGVNLTFSDCQAVDVSCSVKKDGTGCIVIQSTCQGYEQQSANCFRSTAGLCIMNNAVPPTCQSVTQASECVLLIGQTGLDHAKCQAYNSLCTSLSDGSGCQPYQQSCISYSNSNSCTIIPTGKCFFSGGSCISITSKANCSTITGLTGLDHAKCQAYFNGCTSIGDGTGCQELKNSCEDYPGTVAGCTRSSIGKCYLFNNTTCITIANPGTDCVKITGPAATITYEFCQSYNTACSVNRARSSCIQQFAECTSYTQITNCYQSKNSRCIASNIIDTGCVSVSTAQTCEVVYLGIGNYSEVNCNAFKSGCTYNGNQCATRICSLATGFAFTHLNCYNWLNTCTVNNGNNACITMAQKCTDQNQSSCLRSIEGECVVFNSQCVKKTCDSATANENYNTDGECSTYLQQCTVARTGGCQSRTACSDYISQLQCTFNRSGGKCFWNPTLKNCVDLSCGLIEKTSSFDTHAKCMAVDAKLLCTVRAAEGIPQPGCMARIICSSYSTQDQCHLNHLGNECVWNTNSDKAICQEKSCYTAPLSTVTHNDCYSYYNTSSVTCTVSINDGELGGCQQTADCALYAKKEQCQINWKGETCAWIETSSQCADKSCETAPATSDYDDDSKCRSYISNKCTVSQSGQGCVNVPASCEIMTEKQCYFNKNGDPCYWTGTICVTRSCENAPDSVSSADECNAYLAGCTSDTVKCKTKVCEDYQFTTDALCQQELSTCTSNGKYCVTRGSCFQATSQAGCVTSSTGQSCEWIAAQGYCTIKNCLTAPLTLTTEEECANYFTKCTTKKGGGCITKSTCAGTLIEAGCTTALNGTVCFWDAEIKKCRDRDCQDFNGNTHHECQLQRTGCTMGINGKCARVQNCKQTTIRGACIEGADGPCLWIEKYENDDGSKGACFKYTSCKSLSWDNDQKCKLVSSQCTTNGSHCVGISLCSETNTNGGCVTGYDGACIQSVPALNSSDPKVCKPFNSCIQAYYITHSDCQQANNKCTTNGVTGCIALGECSSYTSKAGCYINDKGLIISGDLVISTGICIWNNNTNKCRDQECSDLTGSTHSECSSKLSKCTSNGAICVLQGNCSTYTTQGVCLVGKANDGPCFWDQTSTTCRIQVCKDIQNGNTPDACSIMSCVTDGTNCIPKANCSTYKNKTTCNQGGLDGICVFTQTSTFEGTCSLMTNCASANKDQSACNLARDRCHWHKDETTNSTQCVTHTCATNQAMNGSCTRFFNWDKKTQQICAVFTGVCQAVDPSTLSKDDCFLISGYTYTWSTSNNKCGVCTTINQSTNTTNNNSNQTTNNITTNLGYHIGVTIIILGYLIF
ncbi:unnamed protein product [Paramecium primaurelia]|uniref:PSI domain-containing protein n=1 Tax=Paramecium primaurelia TaxID=5886 RepID=A0A8S1LWS9_PARPR|nr:unnamed protein product [Paramecium primaurelia]